MSACEYEAPITLRSGTGLSLFALSRWLLVERHNGDDALAFASVCNGFCFLYVVTMRLLRSIYKCPDIHISYIASSNLAMQEGSRWSEA